MGAISQDVELLRGGTRQHRNTQVDPPSPCASQLGSRSNVQAVNILCLLSREDPGRMNTAGNVLNGQTSEMGECVPFPGTSTSSSWVFFADVCPLVLSLAKSQGQSIYPNIPDFSQSPFAGLLLMYRQMIS